MPYLVGIETINGNHFLCFQGFCDVNKTAGIDAMPGATDFSVTFKEHRTLIDLLPDVEALLRTTYATKEYVGYAYYRWKG